MVEQLSIFDLLEKTSKEYLIKWSLLKGSDFADSKQRIIAEYKKNPKLEEFAAFLKDEYGYGGYGGYGMPGGTLYGEFNTGFNGAIFGQRNNFEVRFSWKEMAKRISKLIDSGEYVKEAGGDGVIYE